MHFTADLAAAFGSRPDRLDQTTLSCPGGLPVPHAAGRAFEAAGDAGRQTVITLLPYAFLTPGPGHEAAFMRAGPLSAGARVLAETADEAGGQ